MNSRLRISLFLNAATAAESLAKRERERIQERIAAHIIEAFRQVQADQRLHAALEISRACAFEKARAEFRRNPDGYLDRLLESATDDEESAA